MRGLAILLRAHIHNSRDGCEVFLISPCARESVGDSINVDFYNQVGFMRLAAQREIVSGHRRRRREV